MTMLARPGFQVVTDWIEGKAGADERLAESSQSDARSHVIEVVRRQAGEDLAKQVEAELDAAESKPSLAGPATHPD